MIVDTTNALCKKTKTLPVVLSDLVVIMLTIGPAVRVFKPGWDGGF
jgi:hypothetical protein